MRTESEVLSDWVIYYKKCPKLYQPLALLAILRGDGPKMLSKVLRELKLEKTADLLSEMERDW